MNEFRGFTALLGKFYSFSIKFDYCLTVSRVFTPTFSE